MFSRVTSLGLALLSLLAGCGTVESEPGPDWSLEYRLSGGEARYDVVFVIDSEGEAVYDRRHPDPHRVFFRFDENVVEALERLVESHGFLKLEAGYGVKGSRSVSGFRYELAWVRGDVERRVVAHDGVVLPEPFLQLREAVGSLQRRVLSEGTR